jgi:hypothetical protein
MYGWILLIVGLAVVLGVAGVIWTRARRSNAVQFEFFRCDSCGQKIRYLSSKAGRMGMCPRCKERWTLAKAPPSPAMTHSPNSRYPARVGQVIRRNSWYRGRVVNQS